jgi:hypothetical protein
MHVGAVVMCAHAGTAQPTAPVPRVLVRGQPVVTIATPYAIAGCTLAAASAPFCVTGQWVVGATRVLATGVPVAVQTGTSVCVPTGTPMVPVFAQPRVTAS